MVTWGETPMTEVVKFEVKNMTCDGCSNAVTKILKRFPEVKEAKVSWKDGEAVVELEQSSSEIIEKLQKAITEAGYPASLMT